MLRKILSLTLILILTITSVQIFSSNAFTDGEITEERIEGEEPYLTIDFVEAINIDNIEQTIDGKDVETIKGTYIIDGTVISYEYRNINNLDSAELVQNVKSQTEELITGILNHKGEIFPEYNNVDAKEISENINIKRIITNGKKDAEKLGKELQNKNNIKFSKHYKKIIKIKDDEQEKANKENSTNLISSIFEPMTVHAETKGGEPQANKKSIIMPWDVQPTQGDRQDRLGLYKRTTGSQYNWLPTKYWVDVFEIEGRTDYRRQVNIGFEFNATRLGNLNIDDNETLEAEVSFYNYGWHETLPDGHAYIYDQQYFAHNVPADAYPYQDTRYKDTESKKYIGKLNGKNQYRTELEEVSYCIGVANTNKLVKDTKYWCIMQGYPYHYYTESGGTFHPEKGHARLTFQRGYNFVHYGLESRPEKILCKRE